MINYLKIDKAERAHIMERRLAQMERHQGFEVQDAAIILMNRTGLDYTEALEILMELGVNFAKMERDGLLSF